MSRDHDATLAAVSAALDGEGPWPDLVEGEAAQFRHDAERIRRLVRVAPADPVPDMTSAVLARVGERRHRPTRLRTALALAAAFLIGVAASAAFILDRDLRPAELSATELDERILAAQTTLSTLDADVELIEHGVHPDVPERTYRGRLTYEAPERLTLELLDLTEYPDATWPRNDVELVVSEDRAWTTGVRGCPVDHQPECLSPWQTQSTIGRAPFSTGWPAPLDLVLPVGPIIRGSFDSISDEPPRVVTTVGRSRAVVDGLIGRGSFRAVHTTDTVTMELDPETLALDQLTITAGDEPARRLWATTWGYDDEPRQPIVQLRLTALTGPPRPAPPAPPPGFDGGFRSATVDAALTPGSLPAGFEPHRSGTRSVPGSSGAESIATWSNGRGWLSVRSAPRSPVGLRPTAHPSPVGAGTGYVDPVAGEVTLLVPGLQIVVSGSLSLDQLVAVAASLEMIGEPLHLGSDGIDSLQGWLVPEPLLHHDNSSGAWTALTTAPSGAFVVVVQRSGHLLAPPQKTDVVEVAVGDHTGRYSATLGTLTWVETGIVVELQSAEADLDDLLAVAAALKGP